MELMFEKSRPGRKGYTLPKLDCPDRPLKELVPEGLLREKAAELPELAEVDVVRHFNQIARRNYGVDTGFYPLGSCTMKYNPKINEEVCRYPGFSELHPYLNEDMCQGTLQLLYEMEQYLSEITGLAKFALCPAAGAHGESTGLMIIAAYHASMGNRKTKIIVPDSAHGTNPASAVLCGFKTVHVKSDSNGCVDLGELENVLDDEVAAFMLTNPNTLGLFDQNIHKIADMVHAAGGLLYYDGANANAILGKCRPGDMGFDVCHINLHKTFSTPHGGGGPGSGPVGVTAELEKFLPTPVVEKDGDRYFLEFNRHQSIGRINSFYGNIGVIIRAYTYIRMLGLEGLTDVAENAVLNANYLQHHLKKYYKLTYDRICMHEFVLSSEIQQKNGVHTKNIAKRLIDLGIHPPTVYFPLIVNEALMIEPTETESRETLDKFIAAMVQIAKECEETPQVVLDAPKTTVVGMLDEVEAVKRGDFCMC